MLNTRDGQMTVEFVVAFPVMMIVALIAINALLFVSECAAFDRLARQLVCVHASAPGYGEGSERIAARIESQLKEEFSARWLDVHVDSSGSSPGYVTYVAQLDFSPTLIGGEFSGSAFGITITPLSHQVQMTIDPYKPGAIV